MSDTPRPYDENFIEEQLRYMRRSNWTVKGIARWFARWGYEEGKAVMMRKKEEKVEMKFEKCDFRDATHILLADGETVRQIAEQRPSNGSPEVRMVNNAFWTWVDHVRQLGATFVREIDNTPEPWEDEFVPLTEAGGVPVIYLPHRFKDRRVRVRIEVAK